MHRFLLALPILLFSQDIEREARILRWVISIEAERFAGRPLLVSLVSLMSLVPDDASPPRADQLTLEGRLRASGVTLAPLTARPGADTTWLRISRLMTDSVHSYRLGVERYTCRDGRLQGERSMVTLHCESVPCRAMIEEPIAGAAPELGTCE